MKIVVASDNHCSKKALERILQEVPDADYYWHLGDSEFDPKELAPFVGVMGNNDYFYDYPDILIFEKGGHRFLLTHGHRQLFLGLKGLVTLAQEKACDIVLYGHTHNPSDNTIDDIRLINPGSCFHNRSGMKPSYCVLNISSNGKINSNLVTFEDDDNY